MRRRFVAGCAASCVAGALAQPVSLLAPLALPGAGSAWREALLPGQTKPRTEFSITVQQGRPVLALQARASYANLAHTLAVDVGPAALWLSWSWRVDRFIEGSDLRYKSGDDVPVKVCAAFDLPITSVPLLERQLLRIARSSSAEPLPAATLCYVWDRLLPAQTEIDNAFTRRVRYIVLQGAPPVAGVWRTERRDLRADFLKVFGDESREVPPLIAVLVGADADNTKSESKASLADLMLTR